MRKQSNSMPANVRIFDGPFFLAPWAPLSNHREIRNEQGQCDIGDK